MAITLYTLPAPSTWKPTTNIIGVADVSGVYVAGTIGSPGITPLPSTVIEQQLGSIVTAQSNDSTYGGMASFVFLAVPVSTTVTQGLNYTWKGDFTIVVQGTTVAAGVQSGLPVAIALNTVASNATSVQYTWFAVQGKVAGLKGAALRMQPSVPLFVSNATAGRVQSTASTLRSLMGFRSANTATATGSIIPIYLNFPNIGPGL